MRAVQIVCWLLAAIYLLAALGSVVASGEVSTGAVELAVNAPALLVAAPVVVGRVAQGTIEAGVDALCGESAEWKDIVDAWTEGFMRDMRADATDSGIVDRRCSNGGGHVKEEMGSIAPRSATGVALPPEAGTVNARQPAGASQPFQPPECGAACGPGPPTTAMVCPSGDHAG